MRDRLLMTATAAYEDYSGVDGDGLGEGEVAFEGEEQWWEEEWVLQSSSSASHIAGLLAVFRES